MMRLPLLLLAGAISVAALGCSASDASSDSPSQPDASAADTGLDTGQPQADAGQDAADDAAPDGAAPDAADDAAADGTADDAAPDAPATHLIATIETSFGVIRVELDGTAAPITVDNFRKYADAEYFDGLLFHRVIPDFMIQGGGLEPGLKQRATLYPPIINEASASGLSNLRGTIAMARTSNPNSATSQFFINTVDNTFLDPGGSDPDGYAVFGKVVEGMDVVDQIEGVPTHTVGAYQNVPVDDVVMQTVRVTVE